MYGLASSTTASSVPLTYNVGCSSLIPIRNGVFSQETSRPRYHELFRIHAAAMRLFVCAEHVAPLCSFGICGIE